MLIIDYSKEIQALSGRIKINETSDRDRYSYKITLDGHHYYEWYEGPNKEDLVWYREIGKLALAMIRLGIEIGNEERRKNK